MNLQAHKVTFFKSGFDISAVKKGKYHISFNDSSFTDNCFVNISNVDSVVFVNTQFQPLTRLTFENVADLRLISNNMTYTILNILTVNVDLHQNNTILVRNLTALTSEIHAYDSLNLMLEFSHFEASTFESTYKNKSQVINLNPTLYFNYNNLYQSQMNIDLQKSFQCKMTGNYFNFSSLQVTGVEELDMNSNNFSGSLPLATQPRCSIELTNITTTTILKSTFSDSLMGALLLINCQIVHVSKSNFIDNTYFYPFQGGGAAMRCKNSHNVTINSCIFDNNVAVYYNYAGTMFFDQGTINIINSHLVGPKRFNYVPVTVLLAWTHATRIYLSNATTIRCPRNSINVRDDYKSLGHHISCIPCTENTYKINGSELFVNKNDIKKASGKLPNHNASCYPCPYGGICEDGIRSRGNYWGYLMRHFHKDSQYYSSKVKFVKCPEHYCCSRPKECKTYQTCAMNRKGMLCGECEHGFSASLIGSARCVRTNDCHGKYFWPLYVLSMFIFLLIFLYLKEILIHIKFWLLPRQRSTLSHARTESTNSNEDQSPSTLTEGLLESDDSLRNHSPYLIVSTDSVEHEQSYVETNQQIAGLIKISLFFYQAASIIRVNSITKHNKSIMVVIDFLTSVFDLRLNAKSGIISVCPMKDLNRVSNEIIKLSFIVALFILLGILFVIYYFYTLYSKSQLTIANKNNGRVFHSINEDVPMYSILPFNIRLLRGYLQLILFSYSTVTTFFFSMVYCVPINDELRLFINGEIRCFTLYQIICFIFIGVFIAPFSITLLFACKWLKFGKITPYNFLSIMFFPPFALYYGFHVYIRKQNLLLNRKDAMLAKHLLLVINEPFRVCSGGKKIDERGHRLEWEWILILRRIMLVSACRFISYDIAKMVPVTVMLLIFLFQHLHVKPYGTQKLNVLETISLMLLIVLTMVNMFWAFTEEFDLLGNETFIIIANAFFIFEFLIIAIPIFILALAIISIVIRKLMQLYKHFILKQD